MTRKASFSSPIQKQHHVHIHSDKDYVPSNANDMPTTAPVNPTEDDNRPDASNVDQGRPGTSCGTCCRKSNPNCHKRKSIKADRNHRKAYRSHLNKSYKAKKPKEMLNHKHNEKSGYRCSKVKEENPQQFFESFWGNGENSK
uniref:Uncharacterized protein n=1 Tax=Romanomermis culicivorax TaxID=13658 RepID=A0A915KWK5_ROMCU